MVIITIDWNKTCTFHLKLWRDQCKVNRFGHSLLKLSILVTRKTTREIVTDWTQLSFREFLLFVNVPVKVISRKYISVSGFHPRGIARFVESRFVTIMQLHFWSRDVDACFNIRISRTGLITTSSLLLRAHRDSSSSVSDVSAKASGLEDCDVGTLLISRGNAIVRDHLWETYFHYDVLD